jgi:hypothetical protein
MISELLDNELRELGCDTMKYLLLAVHTFFSELYFLESVHDKKHSEHIYTKKFSSTNKT